MNMFCVFAHLVIETNPHTACGELSGYHAVEELSFRPDDVMKIHKVNFALYRIKILHYA